MNCSEQMVKLGKVGIRIGFIGFRVQQEDQQMLEQSEQHWMEPEPVRNQTRTHPSGSVSS